MHTFLVLAAVGSLLVSTTPSQPISPKRGLDQTLQGMGTYCSDLKAILIESERQREEYQRQWHEFTAENMPTPNQVSLYRNLLAAGDEKQISGILEYLSRCMEAQPPAH